MKPPRISLFFSRIERIEIGKADVFDERDRNDHIWAARMITLVGHDGSKIVFSVHSDLGDLPVVVDE